MHVPESWQTLARDIVLSHAEPMNSQLQLAIFGRCMRLLSLDALKDEVHLFCLEPLALIAGQIIIMFLFPGTTSPQRQVVEARLARSLLSCCRCVRGFYTNLAQMRLRFVLARQISVAHILSFLDVVNEWVYLRLEPLVLGAGHARLLLLLDAVRLTLYECLSNVTLLRAKPNFRAAVASLITSSEAAEFLQLDHLLPLTIFYYIEGNTAEQLFAQLHFKALRGSIVTLDPQVIDEIKHHSFRLQNARYFNQDFSVRFWQMIQLVFMVSKSQDFAKLLGTDELDSWSAHTQIQLVPLMRVFFNNLLSCFDRPFPILLLVFRLFLDRFGPQMWALVQDVHYTNVVDTVFRSAFFQKHLHHAALGENPAAKLAPLLEWIPSLISSLTGPQKQTAAIKVTSFLVQRELADRSNTRTDSAAVLLACFESLTQPQTVLASLLKMQDARVAVNRHTDYFVGLARKGSKDAMSLVCACLKYDIALAVHNLSLIQQKKSPTLFDSNNALWASLAKVPLTLTQFASKILESLIDVLAVLVFKDSKGQVTKEFEAALKIHNRDTTALCGSVCSILEKLALMDPEDLKVVLSTEVCLVGIWSCIFNPLMNQSALTVIYQVHDSEGRYENIWSLLNDSLNVNVSAINKSLLKLAEISAFEPCPKALRILMDIITALADPLKGILNTQTGHHVDSMLAIRGFWESCWLFLVMIYKKTLVWAGLYHLSDLIEFTRDTLDASHLLLDSFRVLMDFFSDPSMKTPLFETFMNTFIHMIVWLRLGDVSLLNSCVDLVFKGFDLAKELDAHVDKNFIITFAKYGAKAKKFNNKLTEQQRGMILSKASDFDAKLVQYVVDESAKERMSVSPPASKDDLSDSSLGASYAYQSRKGAKQSTLSRFGVVTNDPPVAPPPLVKNFKPNNLEAIRNELKNNRAPTKPVINPAPPRPAGFNHKTPAVGRYINGLKKKHDSDSSDEDDEADVDVSDLFLESKKKPKVIEVDFNGRPIPRLAQAKKINTKRQEEERMRMRLNVNLKPLYSTVLKWNYNTDSEFPTDDRDIYKPIKDSYSSAKEYVAEIEPLLMLECWQGIQSSRVTGQELPFELLVGSRTTCDGFFDVYVSMKKADLAARKIGETDLLVLGYVADKDMKSPHEISRYLKLRDSQTCLAKVREIKYANPDYSDVTVRVYPQGSMMGLLTPKSVVVGMKVMQMITVEREYSSLRGLPYYDLCDEILAGKPCKPKEISDEEARGMCGKLGVNMSQAKAIIGANREEGFSLIQGPPGTGKTKTILGIVGHFLSSVAVNPNTIITPVPNASSGSEESKPVNKVLICAPSNAAVDELVVRLKDGVFNDSGQKSVPKIVRLGRSDAVNPSVRHLCLEELIESQLKARAASAPVDPNIRVEHNKCLAERDRIREALKKQDLPDPEIIKLQSQLREVTKKRSELGKRLDEQRENQSIAHRTREIEKRQVQAKILSEAQVICSTLSGSAHDFLASMSMKFDQVIIDEACQCVELSAIIPLRYGCKKCVMVGDPNQLPPTVLSQKAASYKYEESLFVRMQKNNLDSIYLLDVQYRMHPEISRFPSAQFYNSRLSDGAGMLEKNKRPWHNQPPLAPYKFFDIVSRHQQNQQSKSFFNAAEARVALELVETLMRILPENEFKGRIGIISPYKEQIRTLRDTFQKKFGTLIFNEIDFNTVDGFQGQEKEIIIMSCVRASENGSVGFLSDVRRMNVALTRARTTLWILGNKSSLRRDRVWNKLISDAESRSCVSLAQPGFLNNMKSIKATSEFSVERTEAAAHEQVPIARLGTYEKPDFAQGHATGTSIEPQEKPSRMSGGADSHRSNSDNPDPSSYHPPVNPSTGSYRPSSVGPQKSSYRSADNESVKIKNSHHDETTKRKLNEQNDDKRKHKKKHVYIHKPQANDAGRDRPGDTTPSSLPLRPADTGENGVGVLHEPPVPKHHAAPPRASNSGIYRTDDRPRGPKKPTNSSIFIKPRKPHRPAGPRGP
ncbi:senataxin [Metschnikowia aff. pulcherrima]|uniref:Senataxin n=1 Tax=Metschnikowia aff. pulcherrima TaxID=2163413 RepID=A0A4P6XMQ7_9ASCO|nr:senataxin [Metschnikowia aff. pulcherrima]